MTEDRTRREFMADGVLFVGTTSLLAMDGTVQLPEDPVAIRELDFQAVADLMGKRDDRPADPGELFDAEYFAYRYETTDTDERFFRRHNDDTWQTLTMAIDKYSTPFQALKTAPQQVQFAIDPSRGLTRQRYGWFSNGTLFDSSLFSNDPGEIGVATTASSTDRARIRSAFAGQYVAQALAQPGIEVAVDSGNVSIDSDGFASISHGRVIGGAFWWDTATSDIETGIGLLYDSSAIKVFWVSDGTHLGDSPVSQPSWNLDRMNGADDGDNPSGLTFDPSAGWVTNDIYWFYNRGRLTIGMVDPASGEVIEVHEFVPREDEPGEPNLATPNLPTQLVVENGGTAASLTTSVGGTQYTLYGADGVSQTRETFGADEPGSANVTTAVNDPIDPTSQAGDPIYAVRREDGRAGEADEKDLELRLGEFIASPDQDVIIYFYDEWDPATALTSQSWEDTFSFNGTETKTKFDRSATAYSPTTTVFRGMERVSGGSGGNDVVAEADIEDRIPIGATRVVTGVDKGQNATVAYTAGNLEGY